MTTPIAGDPRFFAGAGPFGLEAVVAAAGGTLAEGRAREGVMLHGIAPLHSATAAQVSFIDNRRYAAMLASTQAGAVIVAPALVDRVPAHCVPIVTRTPYVGWAKVAALFHPEPAANPSIHPSALIDPSAQIGAGVEIGPYVVIGPRAVIGDHCRLAAHAVVGAGVILGEDCRVGVHVSLSHALIGARVRIYPGARIGQDGFGFAVTDTGFLSVPQLGRVVIGDDVEIGANTAIDRGSAQDTVIGAGTRIDNLVMIGHNVRLGRGCVIVGQVGISGSTTVGDFVMVGGQAGLTGHLKVGDRARIGAQAGVMNDVEAGADVVGAPAAPVRVFMREIAWLRRAAREGWGELRSAAKAGRDDQNGQGAKGG